MEEPINEDMLVTRKIEKFDPSPIGGTPNSFFDPVVHLEIEDVPDDEADEVYYEEEKDMESEDEDANKVERVISPA